MKVEELSRKAIVALRHVADLLQAAAEYLADRQPMERHACPTCRSAHAVIASRYGPFYCCWDKRGGCGAVYRAGGEIVNRRAVDPITAAEFDSVVAGVQNISTLYGATQACLKLEECMVLEVGKYSDSQFQELVNAICVRAVVVSQRQQLGDAWKLVEKYVARGVLTESQAAALKKTVEARSN